MTEKMSFEEFKEKVEETLIELGGETGAKRSMKIYKDDLPQLYEEGWSIPEAVAAIRSGY